MALSSAPHCLASITQRFDRVIPVLALAGSAWLATAMADVAWPDTPAAPVHELASRAVRLPSRLAPGADGAQDAASWALQARSHVARRDFESADDAYAQALRSTPADVQTREQQSLAAQWLAERAQVRVLSGAHADRDDVKRLVDQALRADAAQPLALALAGDAAYERGEFSAARERWQAAQQHADRDDTALGGWLARRLASLAQAERGSTTLTR